MATPEKIFRNSVSMQQTGFSQEQSEALVRMIQNVVESVVSESLQPVIQRLDSLEARIDETNARIDETNVRVKETNARIDKTNARIAEVNARIDAMQGRLNMLAWMNPGLLLLMFFGFSGIILTLVAILLEL